MSESTVTVNSWLAGNGAGCCGNGPAGVTQARAAGAGPRPRRDRGGFTGLDRDLQFILAF